MDVKLLQGMARTGKRSHAGWERLLGVSREQLCAAFLVLAAVDGAVALPGWCWHVRLCRNANQRLGSAGPSQISGRNTCTPKNLFETPFPSSQQPPSAPARQLAGVTVTGFISRKALLVG